jgi:small GTP-binding protein
MSTRIDPSEAEFDAVLDARLTERVAHLERTLDIVMIGKVCAGKSSLLNALLQRKPGDKDLFAVGATAGVTKEVTWHALTERVRIADAPGLNDVIEARAAVTEAQLPKVDVGIFVVSGAVDATQRDDCTRLRAHARKVFVVLNKADEWDDLEPEALTEVLAQWSKALGVDTVYPTCAKGYDPRRKAGLALDLRGVDALRAAIYQYLAREGMEHLLSAAMADKFAAVQKIIAAACAAVALEAFAPGSALYISATQAAAVAAIYYQYTGRVMTKSQALGMLPVFAAQAVGSTVFLWAKSFLPPTGILDAAAAGVAVSVTLAMLLAVSKVLASGATLDNRAHLQRAFRDLQAQARTSLGASTPSDWRSASFWAELVRVLMYA